MINKTITRLKPIIPSILREPTEKLLGRRLYDPLFDQNQCIYIHIPKTAGTSIGEALFNNGTLGHWKARAYYWTNPKKFDCYYKFTIVRNPWDRLVSAYYYLHQGGKNESDRAWGENNIKKYSDFNSFIENWVNIENIYLWGHFVPQFEFLSTPHNDLSVDYVGKFETLEQDFNTISRKIGVNGTLKKSNASKRPKYKDAYTDTSRKIIEKVYEKDIELFNYEF